MVIEMGRAGLVVPLVAGGQWWESGKWMRDLRDSGGNILFQPSRMVREHGRLRRPERFLAGCAHVAFPAEMPRAHNLLKRCGQRLCLCLYGSIAPQFVMSSRKETRVHYEVGRRDGVAGRPQDVGRRCGRASKPGDREGLPVPQTGFPYITFCFSIHAGTKSRRLNEAGKMSLVYTLVYGYNGNRNGLL